MSEISQLLDDEIPKWRQQLLSNRHSLLEVGQYCRNQFRTGSDKQNALDQSRLYLVQSLASVAYQVNGLANGFLNLLDHGQLQINDLRSAVSQLTESFSMAEERAARRQVGMLTQTRTAPTPLSSRIHGIVFPETLERPGRYQRTSLDVTALDSVGHGVKQAAPQHNNSYYGTLGPGSQRPHRASSTASSGGGGHLMAMNSGSSLMGVMQQPNKQASSGGSTGGSTTGTMRRTNQPQQYAPLVPIAPPTVPGGQGQQPDPYATLSRIKSNYVTGQWWGQSNQQMQQNGEQGGARFSQIGPPASVSIPNQQQGVEKVIATYDYVAERNDELSFRENSVILVIKRNEDGWWEGVLEGDPSQRGLFPSNYVEAFQMQ